jgi:hypothetical protein
MIIVIELKDLEPKIQSLYLQNRLSNFSIDYLPNSLFAIDEISNSEVEIFNFNKVCKLDNRWTGYEVHTGKTEIIIEITNL